MSGDAHNPNPFAPPKAANSEEPLYLPNEYLVTLAASGWGYRRLIVSGPTPAIVEYSTHGLGYEMIRINRTAIKRFPSLGLSLRARLDFEIPSAPIPQVACLEIRSFLLLFVAGARLLIGGKVVYADGSFVG